MTTKRNFWNLTSKLGCLCVVLVPLGLARPAEAKPVLTKLPYSTMATSINDSGVVVGVDGSGRGFVRTPDGRKKWFEAPDAGVIKTYIRPPQINGSGVVTGYYADQNSVLHGFVRAADGTMTTFDAPNSAQVFGWGTNPCAINARGAIAGWYTDNTGKTRGFVRGANGQVAAFDVPGASQTFAMAINDKGEIAGYALFAYERGFVRSATGEITIFDAPGGPLSTRAVAIDNRGNVAGYYEQKNWAVPGYIRHRDGTFATFTGGQGPSTFVSAINAKGTVVGWNETGLEFVGFSRHHNGHVSLIDPPRGNIFPLGINSSGVMVGYSEGLRGRTHGFIWTP